MLNKKVLVAAVIGGLFAAGNAAAAPLEVTTQYYANEIVFPAGGLEPINAPQLEWESGYNYSTGEVKYVRVELTGATFTTALGTTPPTIANGTIGAINGLGTNVITFSVTSTGTNIIATDKFQMDLSDGVDSFINIPAKGDVSVKVSVYDQASQAQAGGNAGLLSIGSYDNTVFLTFADSYRFASKPNILTADIATAAPAPIYANFVAASPTTVPATTISNGTLNNDLGIVLVDTDPTVGGVQPTRQADGSPMTLADLFAATSKIEVEGNYKAATNVTLGGANPTTTFSADATKQVWVGAPTGAVAPLVFINGGALATAKAIAAGDYKATFTPVSADSTKYSVTPLSVAVAGSIRRNGLELQAPLAQVTPGWVSRIVLTNTGSTSPKYSIKVLNEAGNVITTDATKLTGTVKPGTNVISLSGDGGVISAYTAAPRATVVVSVETTDGVGTGTVQGLYQIVNGDTGSISNHVMVRPGTN